MTIHRPLAAALACLILPPTIARAQPAGEGDPLNIAGVSDEASWSLSDLTLRSVSAYWEDDGTYVNVFNNEDRYYTSGQGIELSFDPHFTDELAAKLAPAEDWKDPRFGLGLAIKQHIYTGIQITDPNPPLDDHPYGGYLYFAFSFQRAQTNEDNTGKHDHFELDLGVVGERSQAEAVQVFIHNLFPDNDTPRGWNNQLANELAVNFSYERTWRTRKGSVGGLEFDMLPAAGFDVGNVFIRARGRTTFRVGKSLPDNFGPARFLGRRDHTAAAIADPEQDWSIYGYASLGVHVVAHNIFLAGNTFATSRSVDIEPLVGTITVGLLARYRCFEFGWSQTWQSIEFETQPNGQTWGAWSLAWVKDF